MSLQLFRQTLAARVVNVCHLWVLLDANGLSFRWRDAHQHAAVHAPADVGCLAVDAAAARREVDALTIGLAIQDRITTLLVPKERLGVILRPQQHPVV